MSEQPSESTTNSAEGLTSLLSRGTSSVTGSERSGQSQPSSGTIALVSQRTAALIPPILALPQVIPDLREGPGSASRRPNPLRIVFGALLFVTWGILTAVWVSSTVYLVAHGHPMAAVTAFGAVALLVVLGAMEGLEVSVIDRWQKIWPGRPTHYLARWLAARQLFVASIVTAATLLANLNVLIIPWTSVKITDALTLGVFDLAWTTFTVLWFAQIMPKHLGAMNPDRYLDRLLRSCFPVVELVRKVGVSQPGEWIAYVLEYWFAWPAQSKDELQKMMNKHSIAGIWRELREDVEELESKS
jgi:uncharacterized membrane protein YvlD (DUF360 family)